MLVKKNVICLPTEHQGVHKNSFRNVCAFQDYIGIWKCWFLRRGENQSTQRKTSRSKEENQQQTQPTYDAGSRKWTQDTLVGGERSHHCAIPALLLCSMKLLRLFTNVYSPPGWEARWPHGWHTWLQSERSGFEPWPERLCCVLGQDTLLSRCLSPPRCINGYQRI